MQKGKLWLHQVALFGFLGTLLLWDIVNQKFVFDIGLLWWLLGAMIGFILVFFDRVVFRLMSGLGRVMETKMTELFQKNRLASEIKELLGERYEQKEMVMRSAMFLVVWMVLAFFTATSVVDFFARGFVLGIGAHVIFDLLYDFKYDKEKLDSWFWQIRRTLEPEEKVWFVGVTSVVFILLAVFL